MNNQETGCGSSGSEEEVEVLVSAAPPSGVEFNVRSQKQRLALAVDVQIKTYL